MLKKILFLGLVLSLFMLMIGCTPTPRADLMVLNLDPPDVNCGMTMKDRVDCTTTVTFTIANTGSANAGPFKVLVQADPGLAQQVIVNIFSLASGATVTRTVTLPSGGNCYDPDCTICITVDSLNEILESNEGNNYYCETTIG